MLVALGRSARELRDARGHSQASVAELSGLPVELIDAIERGRHDPSLAQLHELARALEIGTAALLARAEVVADPDEP